MADLLSLIRDKLVLDAVANVTTWKCWIGYYPDTTDQLIFLHLTGGYPQDTHQGENVHQTFQLTVRTARGDYATCEAKWWEAFHCLNDADMSADGINLIQAMASGPLEYIDVTNRVCMAMNFRVVRATPVVGSP